ncbi:Ferroportin1 [Pyrenophora tritici-repentis]|uniref:Solute carrier family 40 member n=1 Tax=Pyrenophora tritici-repentis TaxID=45151 RepID=A0A922N762_9PLEO|nr:Ferroportin1 [Pyrenophora tritici-repentis]KAI1668286.1 Ferroportin1 [Pyrenophora tritici-repentis]KAI1680985.1 Ferroportin1 [Pyrenophora tritici-repentis]
MSTKPRSSKSVSPERDCPSPPARSARPLLWRLYLSHTLSTWNARTFEFGAVIFLAAIFPGTLFFASCYALFRSAAATILGAWIGSQVDRKNRLHVVRQSIIWQRLTVAGSCIILLLLLAGGKEKGIVTYGMFVVSVILACLEKLAFIANTVSVERDWIIVISESLQVERHDLNSAMRRIDLVCKLIAPVGIGLIDGYSTRIAIWVVFAQNAVSVLVEYFAIAHVYAAVPELGREKELKHSETPGTEMQQSSHQDAATDPTDPGLRSTLSNIAAHLRPWKDYAQNPAFLASFALSLLYLTVLGFGSQMTTYLLTLDFTSTHVSLMRLASVVIELSATVAAPWLTNKIGAVRAGLWFINEQLFCIALAIGTFVMMDNKAMLAAGALVLGICLSRLGLWGFDLSVQFLVQEDAPKATRGSFSAIEMSLQNLFEMLSFATTMVFYRPKDFKIPIFISAGAIMSSAACFAGFVRKKRGHLLHTDRCVRRIYKSKTGRYQVLPTIEEEIEIDEYTSYGSRHEVR